MDIQNFSTQFSVRTLTALDVSDTLNGESATNRIGHETPMQRLIDLHGGISYYCKVFSLSLFT